MDKSTLKALKWQILDEYNKIRDLESRYRLYPSHHYGYSAAELRRMWLHVPPDHRQPLRQFQTHLLLEKSKSKLEQLTKLYKPRKHKFINHIIAQYNRGCICYPIEESEFDEVPKCMYKFTHFGDPHWGIRQDDDGIWKAGPHRAPGIIFAEQVIDGVDEIWIEANKPRDMGESVENYIKRTMKDAQTSKV